MCVCACVRVCVRVRTFARAHMPSICGVLLAKTFLAARSPPFEVQIGLHRPRKCVALVVTPQQTGQLLSGLVGHSAASLPICRLGQERNNLPEKRILGSIGNVYTLCSTVGDIPHVSGRVPSSSKPMCACLHQCARVVQGTCACLSSTARGTHGNPASLALHTQTSDGVCLAEGSQNGNTTTEIPET